jgi:uncharacterized NAD(P)/FAD-binding protein YdhS
MSAWSDDPDHFVRWLAENAPAALAGHPDPARVFVPRPLYGGYLESVLADAVAKARPSIRLTHVTDEAIAIQPDSDGYRMTFRGGGALSANQVVLTTGYSPPRDPPVADVSFYSSARYIGDAWKPGALGRVASKESVLLVGAGLTMVDIAVSLHENGHSGSIHAVSRHGIFPLAHAPAAAHPGLLPVDATTATARTLMHRLRTEVRAAAADGRDWRGVTDAQRPITTALWKNLPLVERQRFLRHTMPYWEVHRHRIAPEVAATIDRMRQSGQLTVGAGRIRQFREHVAGVGVTIQPRHGGEETALTVGVVINCTGASMDYRASRPLLVDSMIEHGLVRPSVLGLGLDSDGAGRLVGPTGIPTPNLYTVGVLRKGDLWETTAVPELRVQATAMSNMLVGDGKT